MRSGRSGRNPRCEANGEEDCGGWASCRSLLHRSRSPLRSLRRQREREEKERKGRGAGSEQEGKWSVHKHPFSHFQGLPPLGGSVLADLRRQWQLGRPPAKSPLSNRSLSPLLSTKIIAPQIDFLIQFVSKASPHIRSIPNPTSPQSPVFLFFHDDSFFGSNRPTDAFNCFISSF